MEKKVFDETIGALESLRDNPDVINMNTKDIQIYITMENGVVMELCVAVDDEGEFHKTFNMHEGNEEFGEEEISSEVVLN